uniref:Cytochrome P450, family 2, subfamily N, polypeptide 13 n=1 Tax=Esox lucius TaxID=8010 RepID=A0AAY5KYF5_ESOLU
MWLYNLLPGLDLKGILLFLSIFILIADFLKSRNPPNYPPGPLALPFVGNIFNIDTKKPHIYLTKLADVYGNIFSMSLGRDRMVFVTGYKMVKEALVTQGENFASRPYSPMSARVYAGNYTAMFVSTGLFMSNGLPWRKQRRFALSSLRNFGLGKNSMERVICEEICYLQEEIEKETGGAFYPASMFNNAVANVICQMVFGKRFDYEDHNFQIMLKCLNEAIRIEGSTWGRLYEAFPALMDRLPGPHNTMFSHYKALGQFIQEDVERHKQNLDTSNPRDYIDAFLIEMENPQHSKEDGFQETNLVLCCLDLFLAGSETTTTTLLWALIFLIKYPHIQEKVQAEIDRVIGQSRQPNMSDRPNMPYTDAVIHEIQRMGNIVPLNGPRMANRDTTLGGYFIPKGTSLMPVLTTVLFDKTEWETPDTFNPGHFLENDGKFVRREAFLPFSAGNPNLAINLWS